MSLAIGVTIGALKRHRTLLKYNCSEPNQKFNFNSYKPPMVVNSTGPFEGNYFTVDDMEDMRCMQNKGKI